MIEEIIKFIREEAFCNNMLPATEKPKVFLKYRLLNDGVLNSLDAIQLIELLNDNDLHWGVINFLKCISTVPNEMVEPLFNVLYRYQGNQNLIIYTLPTISRLFSFEFVEKKLHHEFNNSFSWMHKYSLLMLMFSHDLPSTFYEMSREYGFVAEDLLTKFLWNNSKNRFEGQYELYNSKKENKLIQLEKLLSNRFKIFAEVVLKNETYPGYIVALCHPYIISSKVSFRDYEIHLIVEKAKQKILNNN